MSKYFGVAPVILAHKILRRVLDRRKAQSADCSGCMFFSTSSLEIDGDNDQQVIDQFAILLS